MFPILLAALLATPLPEAVTVSATSGSAPWQALTATGGWCPTDRDADPTLTIKFTAPRPIAAVEVEGAEVTVWTGGAIRGAELIEGGKRRATILPGDVSFVTVKLTRRGCLRGVVLYAAPTQPLPVVFGSRLTAALPKLGAAVDGILAARCTAADATRVAGFPFRHQTRWEGCLAPVDKFHADAEDFVRAGCPGFSATPRSPFADPVTLAIRGANPDEVLVRTSADDNLDFRLAWSGAAWHLTGIIRPKP